MVHHLEHAKHVHLFLLMLSHPNWMWNVMVYILFNHFLLQLVHYIDPSYLHPQDYFNPITISWMIHQFQIQWSSLYSFCVICHGRDHILYHRFSFLCHFLPLSHQLLLELDPLNSSSSLDDSSSSKSYAQSPNHASNALSWLPTRLVSGNLSFCISHPFRLVGGNHSLFLIK